MVQRQNYVDEDLSVEFQDYRRMFLPDDCNHREKQPNMTNGDNARAIRRPPTPNPEVQTVKPNERILLIKGLDLYICTFDDSARRTLEALRSTHPA